MQITAGELRSLFGPEAERGSSFIVRSAKDGSVRWISDAFLELIGQTRAEFERAAVDWDETTPPEYWMLDDWSIAQLGQSDIAAPYVKEIFRKDGSRIAVRVQVARRLTERTQLVELFTQLNEGPER